MHANLKGLVMKGRQQQVNSSLLMS